MPLSKNAYQKRILLKSIKNEMVDDIRLEDLIAEHERKLKGSNDCGFVGAVEDEWICEELATRRESGLEHGLIPASTLIIVMDDMTGSREVNESWMLGDIERVLKMQNKRIRQAHYITPPKTGNFVWQTFDPTHYIPKPVREMQELLLELRDWREIGWGNPTGQEYVCQMSLFLNYEWRA